MQAWNLYLAVLLIHYSSHAVELFGYQRLICSANTLLMVHSWLQYDSKFCTLAAADPQLCWDQQNPDVWPECLASGQQNTKCWPCPYCGGTNHFPSNCPCSFLSQPRLDHSRTSNHFKRSSCLICEDCSYQHICLSCEGKHSWAFCSGRRTSSY